jgi:sn-1 stearoyl-lipid 9-desaturase
MAFIDTVLETPSYGWKSENGELIKPTSKQLWREAFSRINIFKDRRNWISAICWIMMVCMVPFFYFFITRYFSLPLLGAFIFYTMIVMGTHGTIWFHRYCTHNSYTFKAKFWRLLTQNLVIKTFPEEIYVVSHHVHHAKSDEPGDPYNPKGGFLYCMLSYVNHQSLNKSLSEADYGRVQHFMRHTGVRINSYKQYLKWGSAASPFYTIALWLINWAMWYGILYLLGGHGLACAIFSAALFWYALIPAFNYTGHGKGEEKHEDGLDFDRSNLSINQWRPGYFAGEWHNNHHLFPASARSGFLKWQLDVPWLYIYSLYKIGAVGSFRDSRKEFMQKYAVPNVVRGDASSRKVNS